MLLALASITASKSPQISTQLWPVNGFGFARASEMLLAQAITVDQPVPETRIRDRAAALAKTAFINEPFAIAAIRGLALEADYSNDRSNARKLFRISAALTRRDMATNIWLIGDFGRLNQVDQVLEYYDRSLRSSKQARELLLPLMVQGLGETVMIDPVVNLLKEDPPWDRQFWTQALTTQTSLKNLAVVRAKLSSDKGYEVSKNVDQRLISELVKLEFYDEAKVLAIALDPSTGRSRSVVRNSDFDSPPAFYPFNWQTFFDGQRESVVNASSGTLDMSSFADGAGLVAQQLVNLPKGRYRLESEIENWNARIEKSLYVTLACAENQKQQNQISTFEITQPSLKTSFVNDVGQCSFFWLRVYLRAQPDQSDFSASLSRLAITAN